MKRILFFLIPFILFPVLAFSILPVPPYVNNCHGELWESGAGSNITVVAAGTYYKWTTSTVGTESGSRFVDCDTTSDTCVVSSTRCGGIYKAALSASLSGPANSDVHCELFVNEVGMDKISFDRTLGVAATIGVAATSGFLTLVYGDAVSARCTSDGNGDVVTIYHMNMNIHKIL